MGDCNKHVDVLDSDPDSYNTLECDAAFCSCPILDEKANVIGVKKFIYVKAISDIDMQKLLAKFSPKAFY